jgi:uncharacterized membrane protein YbhN (UPF0104 family)
VSFAAARSTTVRVLAGRPRGIDVRAAARLVGGATVLGLLLWRLGTAPFVHGIRTVDGRALAAACTLALATTVCAAWRWQVVAGAMGVPIRLRTAVASCYRAQFLNVTLPGGVMGDVHRGVRHGRAAGRVGRSLGAVAWERSAGQAVQLALAVVVLVLLPSPVGRVGAAVGGGALAALVVGAVALRARRYAGSSRWARIARLLSHDVHRVLLARAVWPRVVLASVLVVAGHVATFAVAAWTTGAQMSPAQLLPVALVVLVASGLPVNIAGWGPREGVAVWAFAASGWGAAQGLSTAVAYGVMAFAASLPGAAVLVKDGASRG